MKRNYLYGLALGIASLILVVTGCSLLSGDPAGNGIDGIQWKVSEISFSELGALPLSYTFPAVYEETNILDIYFYLKDGVIYVFQDSYIGVYDEHRIYGTRLSFSFEDPSITFDDDLLSGDTPGNYLPAVDFVSSLMSSLGMTASELSIGGSLDLEISGGEAAATIEGVSDGCDLDGDGNTEELMTIGIRLNSVSSPSFDYLKENLQSDF